MAVLAFAPLAEWGHIEPTLAIARGLRARGHRVIYLTVADLAEPIAARGFEPVIYGEAFYPKGSLSDFEARVRSARSPGERLSLGLEPHVRQWRLSSALAEGLLDATLRRSGVELCLVDSLLPILGINTWRLGIPTVVCSTGAPSELDYTVPPITSSRVPRPGEGPWRNVIDWTRLRVAQALPMAIHGLAVRRLAGAAGFPLDMLTWVPEPGLRLPQVILWPEPLDFERRGTVERCYAGLTVDTQRDAIEFPWERLRPGAPLVYAAFGTQAGRHETLHLFLRNLMAAAAERPTLQFVIATGDRFRAPLAAQASSNGVVVSRAPQLELLAKASVFITHGGAGSIKESLAHGVPMIVAPLAFDQPGNGARIVYRGLGQVVDHASATPESLGAAIDQVLGEPGFRRRAEAMRDRLFAEFPLERALDFIEARLASRTKEASGGA